MKDKLPQIIHDFEDLKLNVLLLGYLVNHDFKNNFLNENSQFYSPFQCLKGETKNFEHAYYTYPDDHWGSQLYMLSRKQVEFLVSKYNEINWKKAQDGNPIENWKEYSPDWSITKEGNRALLFPMVAVEESKKHLLNRNLPHAITHVWTFEENITDDFF